MTVRAEARVNVAAIERNAARLAREARPAQLCAVVKADGYGHGMVATARAALAGGATWLAVATAAEARGLRDAGLGPDVPVLVLGALTPAELELAVDCGAQVTAWSQELVEALVALGRPAAVQVKLDTGLGRLGTGDAELATAVADAVAAAPQLELTGAWTHFATADDRRDGFLAEQLARFRAWAEPLRARHPGILLHAANSAATLREPAARLDLVRCGVALYGLDPFGEDPAPHDLEPVLELVSYLAAVKDAEPGDSAGYGRRWIAAQPTRVATVPIGYGDGWRRGLSDNAQALLHGRRVELVGTVSMDNVTFDVGGVEAQVGDQVVLLGAQGADQVTAEEVARRLQTINYEVTCGLSSRVPRVLHRDREPLPE